MSDFSADSYLVTSVLGFVAAQVPDQAPEIPAGNKIKQGGEICGVG